VDPANPYPEPADLDEARRLGFRTMGRGVIQAPECDSDRVMLRHHYIGRISDGMPNLWAFSNEDGELGGAVVEYRLNYRAPIHEGEIFHQLSGIRSLGAKTQYMVHLMFNETTGELALSAEAVGVAMDLETRKAVPVSDRRRAQMLDLMLP
jgi:acyl-CoA thioester hydrolase